MPKITDLFIDTSGWVCCLNDQDPRYLAFTEFVEHVQNQGRCSVTTNYVIAELVALLSMSRFHLSRQQVLKAIDYIKANAKVEMVYIEQSLDEEAWELLKAHPDKEWSLVDATSFVVMRRFGMTQALTTDNHFFEKGFIRVPGL